jgi:hypothetical protein
MLIITEFCARQPESRHVEYSYTILLRPHGSRRICGMPPRLAFTTSLRLLSLSLIIRQTIMSRRPGTVMAGSLRVVMILTHFRDKESIYRLRGEHL